MATRRTSDSTRTPKPIAAAPSKAAAPSRGETSAAVPPTSESASKAAPAAKAKPAKASTAAQPAAAKPATPRKRVTKPGAAALPARNEVSPETRRAMIAESAYLRAERRGFAPGHEGEDWVAAEREVDALLSADANASAQ